MKKVLSLVLALVLVLGMIPTFADAHETGAQMLFENNFIVGDGTGNLMVEKELTRNEMAVLFAQMYGKEVEAAAFVAPANFTDADTFGWAASFISFAQASEWVKGYPDGSYQPLNVVTGKELLSALMQVLGYEFTWETLVADAAAVGLTVSTEGPILRGAAFETMWVAVSEIEINGEGMTIGEKTGKIEPAAPVVTDLAIESVMADNLKEVYVTFNQEVDEETVIDDNFAMTGSLDFDVALMEDGMTAVVTIDTQMANQVEYTLTVDGVAALTGSELSDVDVKFTAFDATLPTVEGLTYTGPKNFEIEFSEPIEVYPTVTVKTGNSTLSVNTAGMTGMGTNVITVPLFSTMVDGTTYTIKITNAEDFAGYKSVIRTIEAEYVKDVTPPTAMVVEATQEYVLVEFSKPVKGLSEDFFSHSFSAWTALKVTAGDSFDDAAVTEGTEVYVWFYGDDSTNERPIPAGTTSFTITNDDDDIVDLWGNEFAEATFSITVTADKVAPEVASIEITGETEFTVVFTKNVNFTASNVEVLDVDGEEIDGVSITIDQDPDGDNTKEYAVDFAENMAGETVLIMIEDVKDTTLLENKMADFSVALEVTDKTGPVIDKATYDEVENELFVFFNEDVDAETALEGANYYLLNGTTYTKLSVDPEFINGSDTLVFELTSTQDALVNVASTKLFVIGVEDVAGNEIDPTIVNTIQVHSVAVVPTFDTVEATANDTLVVTYNEELALVDIDAYRVGVTSAQAMEIALEDGVTVVTLTFPEDFFLALNEGTAFTLSYNDETLVKNLFDVSPSDVETMAVVDKIKPEVDTIYLVGNEIEITFTETLATANQALYAFDLVVTEDGDELVAGVDYTTTVSGMVLTVAFDAYDATAEYEVASKATITYIKDDATVGNKAVVFDDAVLAEIEE